MRARLVLLLSISVIACGIDQRGESGDASGGAPAGGGKVGFGGGSGNGWIDGGGGVAPSGGGGVAPGGGGTAGSAGIGGTAGGGGGTSAGGGGTTSMTVDYIATVADCLGATAPNPDVCAIDYDELHIDVSADLLGDATSLVYLRFDLDNQTAGATSISAELVLQNVNASNKSGEVHEVAPFKRPDLFGQAPPLGAIIAPDLGAVSVGQAVVWPLSSAPGPNKPFCLGLATTTTDGIGYAPLASATPPKLHVTFSK